MRTESDLLGELQVPESAYYGVQTQRAINNFKISNHQLADYPEFVKALGIVKLGAAQANNELKILSDDLYKAIEFASNELIQKKYLNEFPIDMIQGGAGTSTNMNANEVIANIALEHLGKQKGEYQFCSPNDHVNLSQSTNDAYPSALKIALFEMNKPLVDALESLATSFQNKAKEFENVIKMGRTQLQDAVPMTLGQEFEGFSNTLNKEVDNLHRVAQQLLVINMGATAIGTGLNALPGYAQLCTKKIAKIMNENVLLADNLV
ncbi:MAG: aspartate ammonia-lyase, partial [Algoriella sp.]|nr:aspartate ammonia-lyase [Algoriella sp.]